MKEVFNNAKWIWNSKIYSENEYSEFKFTIDNKNYQNVLLNLASDSNYNLIINGKVVEFGQYADYPTYKVYDSLNITKYLIDGENEVVILVWYYGRDTQVYIKDLPGVIFEVIADKKVIIYSNEEIQSRKNNSYENGYGKILTSQLGFSFKYKASGVKKDEYSDSVVMEKSRNFNIRPNEKLIILDRVPNKVIKLENSYLIDMQEETTGFIDIDIETEYEQNVLIAYSQFLENGHVKRFVNTMDFSVEYFTQKGENKYMNYFRRLSGRYLEIFCEKPIKINYVGIHPIKYPLEAKKSDFKKNIRNRIYDISVRTLSACMHEHYEDTPWREQALYTMDSRNEMLCTYYAYNDFKFARSNLVLISKGLRKDGLLSICYPAGRDIPIPSFSLAYFIEVYEYIKYSNDTSILDDVFEVEKKIINTFINRIDETGLIANFPYPYWNFYEWSKGSENGDQIARKKEDFYPYQHDLILNCFFLYALGFFKKVCEIKGESIDFDEEKFRNNIKEVFYNEKTKLFYANDLENNKFYSVLGNSLAILTDIGDKETAKNMLKTKDIVPITLSMSTYLYEALLKLGAKKYKKYILRDIDRKYIKMLKAGATTFWETEEGCKSLANTGSLCHGWSAMPIYYYNILNGKEFFDGRV